MKFNELVADPIQHNPTLNPKLFQGNNKMKPEVRGALLRIAEDFKKYVEVPFEVIDVVVTGSNVNYNYSAHSDIDLHLITDYRSLNCDREAEELFDTKRLMYEQEYDIDIFGIPVGLYVEDVNTPGVSSGTYSVMNDEWVNVPKKEHPEYSMKHVGALVEIWRKIIKAATKTGNLEVCRSVLKMLRKFRKTGLAKPQGEFSEENLTYMVLRNDQTIKSITTLVDRLHGNSLSLKR